MMVSVAPWILIWAHVIPEKSVSTRFQTRIETWQSECHVECCGMSESCGDCVRYRDFCVRPGTSQAVCLARFVTVPKISVAGHVTFRSLIPSHYWRQEQYDQMGTAGSRGGAQGVSSANDKSNPAASF